MSYKALKLRVWHKPSSDEVRVYIDAKYVERRNMAYYAHGDWIEADENGYCRATFKGPRMRFAEDSAMGRAEVLDMLEMGRGPLPFAELLARIDACQTKGGHFSYVQYEKLYLVAQAA